MYYIILWCNKECNFFSGFLGQLLGKIRFRTAEKTDERIKVMSEVINGIQVNLTLLI